LKFGFVLPEGHARRAADLAREAEAAGWDGFFVWEPVWGIDAWVCLAAAAMTTERIRLGTMLTPLSRMRPWKLASETMTVDRLSNGRVILSVGLGAIDTGFEAFGEEIDRKARAELLDEGLEVLTGLWHGQPFNFDGKHYHVKETTFAVPPPPVQQPRIPIWVVGAWPHEKSLNRALRYDGLLPAVMNRSVLPADVRLMADYAARHRSESTPFDIVAEGKTPLGDSAAGIELVRPWIEAGATWWIEARWDEDSETTLRRLRQGPPV
jgi:alkanesulfonate monooxygenase SsuD/methylene tetrahydromethanopterin reductase-like flavin-dependent oxidoreductase (luciferase family)